MTANAATAPPLVPLTHCWACGGASFTPANEEVFDMTWRDDPILTSYHGRPFWLRRCAACGFLQPEGLPAEPDYFDRLYAKDRGSDWMDSEFRGTYRDLIFRTVLGELGRRLPPGRRSFLDVGAHVGRMVALAAEAGFDSEGAELNPHVAAFAAARTGRPVHSVNAYKLAEAGRTFDAVTLSDVLEHIPDPVAILTDLRRLVRPGGWIAVKVPHGPNQLRKERLRSLVGRRPTAPIATNMGHVNHFTPLALRTALTRAGFDRVDLTVGAPELFDAQGSARKVLDRWVRTGVYRATRLLPGGASAAVALNLQAFARAPEAR